MLHYCYFINPFIVTTLVFASGYGVSGVTAQQAVSWIKKFAAASMWHISER